MSDPRLVEAIVRAVLAQMGTDAPCACHAAPAGCCPDRFGRWLGEGAERFGLQAGPASPRGSRGGTAPTSLRPGPTRPTARRPAPAAPEPAFATVCVNPTWVRLCADLLRGSETRVCTVAGFPLGATPGEVKAYEATRAVGDGACEVDMVVNVGALKSGDYRLVERDVALVVDA